MSQEVKTTMKKLLIITDTTSKQTNGVVRTLTKTIDILSETMDVFLITPEDFITVPLPVYREIDISLNTWSIGDKIRRLAPDYVHIATEGPVGLAGKIFCDMHSLRYTTSFHSLFPEFIQNRFGVPIVVSYPYFRWFHSASERVLVPSGCIKRHLENKGFRNMVVWARGVDRTSFSSDNRSDRNGPKKILCVSRVSAEKGLDDFCQIPVSDGYIKILVGDGPYLDSLKSRYKNEAISFLGKKTGRELAEIYADATVFVFPSRNDTFGLTQLEAMASGTPVIAYADTVSEEIIKNGVSGYLVKNIDMEAILEAEKLDRNIVEQESLKWTWEHCTEVFRSSLVPV